MTLIEKALAFCKFAHDKIGQKRKYTGEPYWVHPIEVMEIVKSVGGSEVQQCVALLHDVVEDTGVPLSTIEEMFGKEISLGVEMLTDVSTKADGNRKARKALDMAHTAKASPEMKTVKLADFISNSASIIKYDPGFAKTYMSEKRAYLEILKDGNPILYKKAQEIVEDYFK